MRDFIKFLVLITIAYFGYTELLPRFRTYQQSKVSDAQEDQSLEQARTCVSEAESVNGDFARELRLFAQPPVDPDMWSSFMIQVSGRLTSADSSCRCPHEACLSAGAALLEQRKLLNQFDGRVRGTSPGITNPAVSQERINNLLARARSEVR